jgi:hypothetical protein
MIRRNSLPFHVIPVSEIEAIPVGDVGSPQVCDMSRITHCLDSRFIDDSEVVILTRRPRFSALLSIFYKTPSR